jgi:ribonuclease-3
MLPPILDDKLELAVFTHPALGNNNNMTYDRLEILGDAYIELIATKLVWERFPDLPAGRVSQIRELLVKNETLSGFAESLGFDRKVSVPANYNTPSKRWTKIKGDVFEAYVAAVILSDPVCGYEIAQHWLTGLWMPLLRNLGHQKAELRCKEALAKKIMGKNVKLEYIEERPSIQQKGGTQTFFVALYLTGWGWEKKFLGSGQGLSKAAAGDEAARVILSDTPLLLEIMSAKESWESRI